MRRKLSAFHFSGKKYGRMAVGGEARTWNEGPAVIVPLTLC